MLKKIVIGSTIALTPIALAPLAQADTLGFSVGGYSWNQNIDGNVRADGDRVDLRDDLDFDSERNNVFFAEFEHPVPFLPNVRVQHTEMDSTETATLNRTVEIDDDTYFIGTDVRTKLDLSHTDLTLFYSPLDNWVKLRTGVTLRKFDDGVKIESLLTGDSGEIDVDHVVPMLYVAARFDLPMTGLYAGVDANGIAYSDSHLYDARVNIGYESPIGLGVEGGYRRFQLQYEDGDDEADVTIDGAYVGVFYHF